ERKKKDRKIGTEKILTIEVVTEAWSRKIVGRKMAESLRPNDGAQILPQRREEPQRKKAESIETRGVPRKSKKFYAFCGNFQSTNKVISSDQGNFWKKPLYSC